tara:strand:+ start:644 stop:760 length:117 start_codon:yes stop_codon:yes gene_type:complete
MDLRSTKEPCIHVAGCIKEKLIARVVRVAPRGDDKLKE